LFAEAGTGAGALGAAGGYAAGGYNGGAAGEPGTAGALCVFELAKKNHKRFPKFMVYSFATDKKI